MFQSVRIGSLFDIPIKLDVTLLIVIPLFAWLIGSQIADSITLLNTTLGAGITPGNVVSTHWPWVLGTVAAFGLFASVILHELGHALVALRYGMSIDGITLWLFGGVAQLTSQPTEWRHELTVALAGPAVSIALGVLSYLVMLVMPQHVDPGRFLFGYLAVMNLALAAFNLLPGFPMDGGRVLRAVLARNRPFAQATQIAAEVGKSVAMFLGLLGVLQFNLLLIGIAFVIYIGAASEARQTMLEAAFEGITVRNLMTPAADLHTVAPETTITTLLDQMFRQRHTGYPVVADAGLVGMVPLDDVREGRPGERDAYTVADVMSTDLTTLAPENDAMEAFTLIQQHDIGRVPVTDNEDALVGLVSRTDLTRAVTIIQQSGAFDSIRAGETRRTATSERDEFD